MGWEITGFMIVLFFISFWAFQRRERREEKALELSVRLRFVLYLTETPSLTRIRKLY